MLLSAHRYKFNAPCIEKATRSKSDSGYFSVDKLPLPSKKKGSKYMSNSIRTAQPDQATMSTGTGIWGPKLLTSLKKFMKKVRPKPERAATNTYTTATIAPVVSPPIVGSGFRDRFGRRRLRRVDFAEHLHEILRLPYYPSDSEMDRLELEYTYTGSGVWSGADHGAALHGTRVHASYSKQSFPPQYQRIVDEKILLKFLQDGNSKEKLIKIISAELSPKNSCIPEAPQEISLKSPPSKACKLETCKSRICKHETCENEIETVAYEKETCEKEKPDIDSDSAATVVPSEYFNNFFKKVEPFSVVVPPALLEPQILVGITKIDNPLYKGAETQSAEPNVSTETNIPLQASGTPDIPENTTTNYYAPTVIDSKTSLVPHNPLELADLHQPQEPHTRSSYSLSRLFSSQILASLTSWDIDILLQYAGVQKVGLWQQLRAKQSLYAILMFEFAFQKANNEPIPGFGSGGRRWKLLNDRSRLNILGCKGLTGHPESTSCGELHQGLNQICHRVRGTRSRGYTENQRVAGSSAQKSLAAAGFNDIFSSESSNTKKREREDDDDPNKDDNKKGKQRAPVDDNDDDGDEVGKFRCPYHVHQPEANPKQCGKSWDSSSRLKGHIKRVHTLPWQCPEPGCFYRNGQPGRVKKHQKSEKHSQATEPMLQTVDLVEQQRHILLTSKKLVSWQEIYDICMKDLSAYGQLQDSGSHDSNNSPKAQESRLETEGFEQEDEEEEEEEQDEEEEEESHNRKRTKLSNDNFWKGHPRAEITTFKTSKFDNNYVNDTITRVLPSQGAEINTPDFVHQDFSPPTVAEYQSPLAIAPDEGTSQSHSAGNSKPSAKQSDDIGYNVSKTIGDWMPDLVAGLRGTFDLPSGGISQERFIDQELLKLRECLLRVVEDHKASAGCGAGNFTDYVSPDAYFTNYPDLPTPVATPKSQMPFSPPPPQTKPIICIPTAPMPTEVDDMYRPPPLIHSSSGSTLSSKYSLAEAQHGGYLKNIPMVSYINSALHLQENLNHNFRIQPARSGALACHDTVNPAVLTLVPEGSL